MSGIFVTPAGFQKKTLAKLKVEYETLFQATFGTDIDLDPSGPFGQLVGMLSKRDADLWDGAQEIYTARNPAEATGTSLDNIAAETGVARLAASKTTVQDVILYGTDGTSIPTGSQVRRPGESLEYELSATVVISLSMVREIRFAPDAPAGGGGTVYDLVLDSVTYSYTSLAGDTISDVIDAMALLIDAGAWGVAGGTTENVGGTELRLYDWDTDFSIGTFTNFTNTLLGSDALFSCTTAGANSVPTNSLTEIVTPVSGWDSVNNPFAGIVGREAETDAQFRIRRASIFLVGNATEEAILQNLLNNVSGITTAAIASNRLLSTDIEGRPPKSFEVVIAGATPSDIAESIWNSMPAGIESYGNYSGGGSGNPPPAPGGGDGVDIVDSQGITQTIYFSRPIPEYLYIKVRRKLYNEEAYPADGDTQIKDAIVNWAASEYAPGKDVIRQRLAIPIYTVPGIGELDLWIYLDTSPSVSTPPYVQTDLVINLREVAVAAPSRIVVETLP